MALDAVVLGALALSGPSSTAIHLSGLLPRAPPVSACRYALSCCLDATLGPEVSRQLPTELSRDLNPRALARPARWPRVARSRVGSLSLVSTAAVITTAPATAITSSAPAALVPPALPRLPQLRGLPPAAEARVSQQHLFRHRFLVCRDVLIRLPIDAVKVGASPTPKPQPPNLQNPDQSPNRETALCQRPLHPPPHPTPPHLRCSEPSLASSPSPDASILRSRRSNTPFSHTWRTHFSHVRIFILFRGVPSAPQAPVE